MKTKSSIWQNILCLQISLAMTYLISLSYSLYLQGYKFFPAVVRNSIDQGDIVELAALNATLIFSYLMILPLFLVMAWRPGCATVSGRNMASAMKFSLLFMMLLTICNCFVTPQQIDSYKHRSTVVFNLEIQKNNMLFGKGCVEIADAQNANKTVCTYEYTAKAHEEALETLRKHEVVSLHEKAILDLSNVPLKELFLVFVLSVLFVRVFINFDESEAVGVRSQAGE